MIDLQLYEADNTTLVQASLPGGKERRWQDRLSDPGGASFVMRNADADNAHCTMGRVVRCTLDGTARFAALIEGYTRRQVAPAEASQQLTAYRCRGTMARHEDWVVYPEVMGGLVGDTRYFNWASTLLDDTAWGAALTDAITSGQGTPPNWPDATIDKISAVYDPDTNAPAGFNWYRKVITVPTTDLYRIFFSADDAAAIAIDGVMVVNPTAIIGKTTQSVDVFLTAGDHQFAVEVENYTGGLVNFIWFLFALYAMNQDGTLGALVAESDATWVAIGFVDPPGFSPFEVLDILLTEAQARGGVPELTLGGTAGADVDAVPWPTTPDIAFRIGLDGLGVLRQLAETYIDCAMDPTSMRLDTWVHGGKGVASGVVLAAGVNLLDALHEVAKPDATMVLTRWANGWLETDDPVLVAAHGRLEAWLSQGTADSTVEATRVAEALIDRLGRPKSGLTVAVRRGAGADPYDDYGIGDTLTAPAAVGSAVYRNRAFTVTEDANGKPFVAPELEAI